MVIPALLLASAAPAALPPCRAAQVALRLDARGGDLDGMSHGGTYLSLRQRRGPACRLPALPVVRFVDGRGRPLPIVRQVPPGLHPGPVMVPVRLTPGARATTSLRWVSGPVYDRSRCFEVARVDVRLAGGRVSAPLSAHVCGPGDAAATVEQPPLAVE